MLKKLVILLAALTALGCGSSFHVIKKSGHPSPFRAATGLVVAIDHTDLRIDGQRVDQYQARLAPAERDDFTKILAAMDASFIKRFVSDIRSTKVRELAEGKVRPGEVVVNVYFTQLERGWFAGVAGKSSSLDARVTFTVAGQVTDEWVDRESDSPSMYTPTDIQRLSNCAEQLARETAKYFEVAVAGK